MPENLTNKEKHEALWTWLANNPDKGKEDWLGWKDNGGPYTRNDTDCFACEEADERWAKMDSVQKWSGGICDHCPCDWGGKSVGCTHHASSFMRWSLATTDADLTEYANQIKSAWVK